MKYKIVILSTIACFAGLILSAQQMTFGPNYQMSSAGGSYFKAIGKYNNAFFIVRARASMLDYMQTEPRLEKFDYSGKQLFKKPITVMDSFKTDKEMYFGGMLGLKHNMVCFMYNRNLSKIYGMKVNENGDVDNTRRLMGQFEAQKVYMNPASLPKGYRFAISSDSTSFLAYYYKEDDENVYCVAYDENLNKLWVKTLKMPGDKKNMEFNECIFTGTKAVFMMDIKKIKKEKPTCGIFVYDPKSDTTSFTKLNVYSTKKSRLIGGSFEYAVNKAGDMVMGSVDIKDDDTKIPTGIYFVSIAGNSMLVSQKNIPFPDDYLQAWEAHKIKCTVNWVCMNKMILTDDKSVYFGAEEMGYDKVMGNTNSYSFGDPVIGKISSSGTMEWIKRIPKKQLLYNGMAAMTDVLSYSYSMDVTDNKIILTFCELSDNLKNGIDDIMKNEDLEKRAESITRNMDARNVCLVTISLSGNSIKRYCLNENEEKPMAYSPELMHLQLAPDKFILYRAKGNGSMMGGEDINYQFAELTIQ